MNELKIDRIVQSRRRTIAIHIAPDATLTVRAPLLTPLAYIKKLVAEKKQWIDKKRIQIMKNGGPAQPKEFIDGEEFLYLGKIHKLTFGNYKELGRSDRRAKVIEWYKQQALQTITERAHVYSRVTGWKFKSIKITKAESRWGSCGQRGSINFSWRLIMAPLEVIDYVVVHELAHIEERNHSARFWNKVSAILPDYKDRRRWLCDHSAQLKMC